MKKNVHDLGLPGCRVAGLPLRIKRLSKVVYSASPQIAGLPGRRVKYFSIMLDYI